METRNIIAAISLSAAVIILYSLFFAPPPVTKENLAEQNKTEQNSDAPSLDQKETLTAIDKLQEFINTYPYSEKMSEANDLVQELRIKLEYKAFEIAKQYNTIRDYKSALIVLEDFISDYPGTPYREDALFYLLDSSYELAVNSIQSKKLERLNNAKKLYDELIRTYPETKYLDKSNDMLNVIDEEIIIFAKNITQ